RHEQRTYHELITEPVLFTPEYNRVINHSELPVVKDELSITLKINLLSHAPPSSSSSWRTVFYKAIVDSSHTPALWLSSFNSMPAPRFTVNGVIDGGVNFYGYEFLLNRWYHIAYTLSDSEKRMNFYIDSKWIGSYNIQDVQNQSFIFNYGPLYIGKQPIVNEANGFNGHISNFRYYNFRLSHDEVLMDYSGEDPTKSIDDKCPNRFFDGLIIGLFLGITVLA
ncbi:16518_t:CDS:2, partial [Dentiscutata erythropus]